MPLAIYHTLAVALLLAIGAGLVATHPQRLSDAWAFAQNAKRNPNAHKKNHTKSGFFAGLAAIVTDEKSILYEDYIGTRNSIDGSQVNNETIFTIASVSKSVTALIALHMYENYLKPKGITLDTDIFHYVHTLKVNNISMSLRQIIHHTSGLRDNWDILDKVVIHTKDSPISLEEFCQGYLTPNGRLSKDLYRPTNIGVPFRFNYSNVGYTLVGYIVEVVTGIPFDRYSYINVLNKVGLAESGPLTARWHLREVDWKNLAYPNGNEAPFAFPGYPNGGFRATALAMAKLMMVFINKGVTERGERILSRETASEWQSLDGLALETGYAQGFEIKSDGSYGNRIIIGHDGGDWGISTTMFFMPTNCPIGVAVFCNHDWQPLPLPGVPVMVARALFAAFHNVQRITHRGCERYFANPRSIDLHRIVHTAIEESRKQPLNICAEELGDDYNGADPSNGKGNDAGY